MADEPLPADQRIRPRWDALAAEVSDQGGTQHDEGHDHDDRKRADLHRKAEAEERGRRSCNRAGAHEGRAEVRNRHLDHRGDKRHPEPREHTELSHPVGNEGPDHTRKRGRPFAKPGHGIPMIINTVARPNAISRRLRWAAGVGALRASARPTCAAITAPNIAVMCSTAQKRRFESAIAAEKFFSASAVNGLSAKYSRRPSSSCRSRVAIAKRLQRSARPRSVGSWIRIAASTVPMAVTSATQRSQECTRRTALYMG